MFANKPPKPLSNVEWSRRRDLIDTERRVRFANRYTNERYWKDDWSRVYANAPVGSAFRRGWYFRHYFNRVGKVYRADRAMNAMVANFRRKKKIAKAKMFTSLPLPYDIRKNIFDRL